MDAGGFVGQGGVGLIRAPQGGMWADLWANGLEVNTGIAIFAAQFGLTSPTASPTMAKVRIPINPLQVGKVGAYSMYVRKGEQVVRQRKNSSNYGEEASRTLSQQRRRVLWSNLVNFYKASAFWMPKAFENIGQNQTVYNRFMQLNIDRFNVALTKEEAAQGYTIADAFKVSDGSLMPLRFVTTSAPDTQDERLQLLLSPGITTSSTLGELSQAIIAENYGWENGDNLAIILFEQVYFVGSFPQVQPHYYEITLDTSSSALVSSLPIFAVEMLEIAEQFMQVPNSDRAAITYHGLVAIHTRKSSGLKVSTQSIKMVNTTYVDQYSTQEALDRAILSYGLNDDVLLAPSFSSAVISEVTLNGSVVANPFGRTIQVTGVQTLVLKGINLSSDSVELVHEGVLYTPLVANDDSLTYILGDNGNNRISVDGRFSFGVEISGVVMPEGLPTALEAALYEASQGVSNRRTLAYASCINYPFTVSQAYPQFLLTFGSSNHEFVDTDVSNWSSSNGTIDDIGIYQTKRTRIKFTPQDVNSPAWILYKGFIVAVLNY